MTAEVELEPVEIDIDGMPHEEPFYKFKIGNTEKMVVIDKYQNNYEVKVEDIDGKTVFPAIEMKGEFWKNQQKTSKLVNQFNDAEIGVEFNKNNFRIQIAQELTQQLELHTDLIIDNQEYDEKETIEERYGTDTIEKAEDLLENRNILKKVKTVLDHRIAGEDLNKLGIFLQLLSKDTEKPLMIFGVQKQGEGKSYIAKNVLNLFPDHAVKDVTDMTKAALYRHADEEPDYFDGKIVFFGEIPEKEEDREIFQIFRQLVSEGEVSKELVIERNGELKPVELRLEGSPVVLSTTVNPGVIDEQDMSRGMAYSPEMTKKQNEKVRSFQNRKREFPEEVVNPGKIKELEEIIQCAMDILSRDEVDLQNPFVRDMSREVPNNTDNVKRDYPKTLQIATEMPAYLYHRQRPKMEVYSGEKTFVVWKDLVRGVVINRKFINNMIRGRTESAMDAFREIKGQVERIEKKYNDISDYKDRVELSDDLSFTSDDLSKWMGISTQTAREYLRKLDRMELIYKDSDVKPHNHYLIKKELMETEGITLQGLYNILASVFNRKEIGEWAKQYISNTDLDVSQNNLLDKIGFSQDDLPVCVDIGIEIDPTLPTPLYMENTESKIEEPT
jgi:hypothetical protein